MENGKRGKKCRMSCHVCYQIRVFMYLNVCLRYRSWCLLFRKKVMLRIQFISRESSFGKSWASSHILWKERVK